MGEEVGISNYNRLACAATGGRDEEDDGRILEWEIGLPSVDDLTPLSQCLIPPELASAFSISPEPFQTMSDVHRASQHTFSTIRRITATSSALKPFPPLADDPVVLEEDDAGETSCKIAGVEESGDAELQIEGCNDDPSTRTLKRPRLVWTPQLHKRFVHVVSHLGIKNAVPKTIMQLMNVEGLTRENVASHLQKYRLYLKRMQGLSNEGPSSSDPLFASAPLPQSLLEPPVPVPMTYASQPMIRMPVFGMAHHHGYTCSPMDTVPDGNQPSTGAYPGYDLRHPYGVFGERPRDWSGGHKFGSIVSYPYVSPNDK